MMHNFNNFKDHWNYLAWVLLLIFLLMIFILEPVLYCSRLHHPIWVRVSVLSAPILIHLPSNTPGKAV